MINVHSDVFLIIRKIFTLFLFTLNKETARTFFNVLENFQRKRKKFVANLVFQKDCVHLLFKRAYSIYRWHGPS